MNENDYKISLSAARVNVGLSQREIAEKMQVSRATVINWETGKVIPKPAEFMLFCSICKAPLDMVSLPER